MKHVDVCLTFDLDAESAQIRRQDEPVKISKGQFAIQRGVPRILELLKKHEIKGTFFICGWVVDKYPGTIAAIRDDGHEIGAHGYLHEELDKLPFNEETVVHEHTDKLLEELDISVKGFRAPYWKLSNNTLTIIAEMGYRYDSSFMDEDRPYIYSVPESPRNLVEFPVEWFMDDWILFETHQKSPTEVFDIWKSQFDALQEMEDLKDSRKIYTLTCHPSCIGHAYRIVVLERLIKYMKSKQARFKKMYDLAIDYLL